MNRILSSNSFRFLEITRDTYHYSDNRGGSPEHYLAYMIDGTCRIVSPRGTIEAKSGDLFYIPKELRYQSYWYGEPTIRFLSFGFQLFPEAAVLPYALQTIPCRDEQRRQLVSLPHTLNPTSDTLGAFYSLLASLLPVMTTDALTRKEEICSAAHQLLREDPHSTVGQLAVRLGISESSLYDAFKSCGKTTPNSLRQEVLCEKAVLLLTTTDNSVQEISDRLNFSSPSYFRKILKLHTGFSPREIRANAKSL